MTWIPQIFWFLCVILYYAFIIIRKAFKMVRFLSLRALLLKEGYDIYIFYLRMTFTRNEQKNPLLIMNNHLFYDIDL